LDFLDLLLRDLKLGHSILPVDVAAHKAMLLRQDDLISELWVMATSTPSQFRFLSSFRERREKLIGCGIKPEKLPEPDWLKS
jgi:hypothetical protein